MPLRPFDKITFQQGIRIGIILFVTVGTNYLYLHQPNQTIHDCFTTKPNVTSSNLFFHKITSGSCASNGLDIISDKQICATAVKSYGHVYHASCDTDENESIDDFHTCSMRPRLDLSVSLPESLDVVNDFLISNELYACDPTTTECECTPRSPCFCMTSNYVELDHVKMDRRNLQANGQFVVTWSLSLGGQESLLDSAFLKAGFEQSVKDYINNDIFCSDDISIKGAEFFGVEIAREIEDEVQKSRAVSGNGKCKGESRKCKTGLNKKKKSEILDLIDDDDTVDEEQIGNIKRIVDQSNLVKAIHSRDEFCDIFLSSTIFDAFEERLVTASAFNYIVDVDVLSDLMGNLDLKYDVSFEPAKGDGLDQVEEVEAVPEEPVPIDTVCAESQCFTQRDVMRRIFDYFEIPFDNNKHECLYQGINCNSADMVTHIWMMNYGFSGKTIPDLFGSLPSLVGLYLGGNELVGTIPPNLATMRKLRMLWLENNSLTGEIPTQLGNLRGLLELNLFGNLLTGTIPSQLKKLKKLQVLNLGNNQLRGSISNFIFPINNQTAFTNGCVPKSSLMNIFLHTFKSKSFVDEDIQFDMKTLSLSQNHLTGVIPFELTNLKSLIQLNLAENNLSGTLHTEMGWMKALQVFDLHGNLFSGKIPESLGGLFGLKVLNLFDNMLDGTIPTEFGRLSKLTEIVLDGNTLSGPIPSQLGVLRNLKHLTVSGNQMSGEIPTELGNLELLENLDLRDYAVKAQIGKKSIAGTIPSELGKLKAWKYPVFDGNGLEGTVPTELGDMQSSDIIWMKNQNLTGEIPVEFTQLKSLSALALGNNSLSGDIPSEFGTLDRLEVIDVGSNMLTGAIPEEIGNMSSLKHINLEKNRLKGTIPTEVGNFKELETIKFDHNDLSGTIPTELGAIESLVTLNLAENNFNGPLPTELEFLSNLEVLVLSGTEVNNYQYFVCLVDVFAPGDDADINCTDACETLDEECTRSNLRGAECSDVGCSGGGTPRCTPFCKLDYSTCDAGIEEMSFRLGFITDHKGEETRWEVRDQSDVVWQSEEIYKSRDVITEYRCMAKGCYQFELFDEGGDGICCDESIEDSGSYSLSIDDVPVSSVNPSFGMSIIHEIGACVPDPSRPSAAPTIRVTSAPTVKVTDFPSYQPGIQSSLPSSNPSESNDILISSPISSPSIQPTRIPSFIPTDLPSTTQPTKIPSSRPTLSPSLAPSVPLTNIPTVKSNKLLAPDGAVGDEFGWDVAISSSTIAVSAPKSGNGKVYLFSADSWDYISMLQAPDGSGSDEFGSAMDILDDVLVIGAVKGNKAYIMSVSGAFASITLSEGPSDDEFGSSVAVDSDTVVVGAPKNDEFDDNSGAAYVFSVAGTYINMIPPPVFFSNIKFGTSVDVAGSHIAVGAPFTDGKGAVYTFDLSGTYLGVKIADSSGNSGDMFGSTLAIADHNSVIGAPFDDTNGTATGSVYFCSSDGITVTKVFAEDASAGAMFGGKVAISSERIIVSAMLGGANSGGVVYVYESDTGVFIEKVVVPDSGFGDEFGRSIAVLGKEFVVGAPYDDDNGIDSGSAYVFH